MLARRGNSHTLGSKFGTYVLQHPGHPSAHGLCPAASGIPVEESGMGLKGLVRILQRRRRIFLATTVAVTLVAGLWTVYRRINSPVFLGGFSLLISDPISESGRGQR